MIEQRNLGPTALTWLTQEGFSTEQSTSDGFSTLFKIYSSARPDYKMSISQATGHDKIILSTGVMLGDGERERLRQIPYEIRAELIKGLGAVLHGRNSLFQIDEEQGVVTRITISKAIYYDGFTKDRLMTSVNELFAAHALVLLHLESYFQRVRLGTTEEIPRQAGVAPAAGSTPRQSYCPRCRAQVSSTFQFCGNCGEKLT